MGTDLFDRFPQLCAVTDDILGYSIRKLCLNDGGDRLRQTQYAQPALFVVNALGYLQKARERPEPDFLAGHSLGEYGALFAAGCFDFETGLRLVRQRGQLMARAGGGAMVAVVGPGASVVGEVMIREGVEGVDVANYNSPSQVVLSGPPGAIRAAAAAIERETGTRCLPLNVSAAFHSRYMKAAASEFEAFLGDVVFTDPRIPVISNVTARPYAQGSVRELLGRQVRSPVRWWESMRYLLDNGVEDLVEVGPGRVLTGLWTSARQVARPVDARSDDRRVAASGPTERAPTHFEIRPESLGSAEFRRDYGGLRYAYLAGSMYKGNASAEMVIRMARAGLMGFFGAGGLELDEVEEALRCIQRTLGPDVAYGMNLLHASDDPDLEEATVDLYLRHGVRFVEAAGYTRLTPPLVRFRFSGARRDAAGRAVAVRHVLAKASRPEVAGAFMRPPPVAILGRLMEEGKLTAPEAEIAAELPVSDDLCVEADSGGHTDGGVALALVPAMMRLRDELMAGHRYRKRIRVGAAGGIGTPEAVAAVFALGADFVLTGSVNQCSPEAGISAAVKEMLAGLDVQDTTYAPAGDLFELDAKVQVVRKGTLFPARANKLHRIYRQCGSLEEIDPQTRRTIETTYFRRSFEEVWQETRDYLARRGRRGDLESAERDPKRKMAWVFKWYFVHAARMATQGVPDEQVNYQIQCGPAMGAFNRFVRGTELEDWRRRHVDVIAARLMSGAAAVLERRLSEMTAGEVALPDAGVAVGRGPLALAHRDAQD